MNPEGPFRFRLERVKRVREHDRRDRERKLLAADARCRELAQSIAGLRDERSRVLADLEKERAERVATAVEREAWSYLDRLSARQASFRASLRDAERERDARRADFMNAFREVRVLELLEERQREAHRREARRVESRQLDRLVSDHSRWRHRGEPTDNG